MSHALPFCHTDIESSLSDDRMTDWEHTANAATVSEHEVFTNMSAWLIEKKIGWAGHSSPIRSRVRKFRIVP